MEIKEMEQRIKEIQREGMLMLLDTADKVFMSILNEQKDENMVKTTKKICEAYRACIAKTIEVNTQ